ncbi:MAG: hypothetical protein IJW32_05960 [Clostridia bacterium]|nr:hypothetical protein [Clostridia bacterium]MBQ9793259.1 hypothetical protein [Clostridia bacterium]
MIISNVRAKIVSLNSYFRKDSQGNKTDVKGYMITLATDFRDEKNSLKNNIIFPLCSKDFEFVGDESDYDFGDDVLVTLDLPIVAPGDEGKMPIMLISMSQY